MSPGVLFLVLGSVFHEKLLLEMVCHTHELLKITDKLIFQFSDYIQQSDTSHHKIYIL